MMPGNRRKSTARLSKKLQSFVLTGSLHADGTDGGRKYGENGVASNSLTVSRFADIRIRNSLSYGTEHTVSRRRRGFSCSGKARSASRKSPYRHTERHIWQPEGTLTAPPTPRRSHSGMPYAHRTRA